FDFRLGVRGRPAPWLPSTRKPRSGIWMSDSPVSAAQPYQTGCETVNDHECMEGSECGGRRAPSRHLTERVGRLTADPSRALFAYRPRPRSYSRLPSQPQFHPPDAGLRRASLVAE